MKHEATWNRAEVQVAAEGDEGHADRLQVRQCRNHVLKGASESKPILHASTGYDINHFRLG